jgi:hypothetical protein
MDQRKSKPMIEAWRKKRPQIHRHIGHPVDKSEMSARFFFFGFVWCAHQRAFCWSFFYVGGWRYSTFFGGRRRFLGSVGAGALVK